MIGGLSTSAVTAVTLGVCAVELAMLVVLAIRVQLMSRELRSRETPAVQLQREPTQVIERLALPAAPVPPSWEMPVVVNNTDTGRQTVIHPTDTVQLTAVKPAPEPVDIRWPKTIPRPVKSSDLVARYRREHGGTLR